jgi:proteasome lid subunit RPN8/RPN11
VEPPLPCGRGKQLRECDAAFVLPGNDPVVVTASVRAALVAHANAELPNEACGLVLFEGDVAVEYVPGRNASPSPYHYELELDPLAWAELNDRDVTQAVFHSHVSSPPRPSRTDVQNVGLWAGQPYLIYTVRTDELAGWLILGDGSIEPIPLVAG